MCRNIRLLFNFEPPATSEEILNASQQFVRKISGFNKISQANEEIFNQSILKISDIVRELIDGLVTTSTPKNRDVEAEKRRLIFEKRKNV